MSHRRRNAPIVDEFLDYLDEVADKHGVFDQAAAFEVDLQEDDSLDDDPTTKANRS